MHRFPDLAPLRVSLAVDLVKARQVENAERVLKTAFDLDPDMRLAALDHPGLHAIREPPSSLTKKAMTPASLTAGGCCVLVHPARVVRKIVSGAHTDPS